VRDGGPAVGPTTLEPVFEAILWGVVQGLTEFLPVSSSGHLRLVPEILSIEPPDLATTAVLHLGTLVAVLAYYRADLKWMLTSLKTDRLARRLVTLLAIGTVPAMVVGLAFSDQVERLQESTTAVGLGLIFTAAVLAIGERFRTGEVKAERAKPLDALLIGLAQAAALIPGVSRSGMTISTGSGRGLSRHESARFAFLLSIPVIFGSGLLEIVDARSQGDLQAELLIGITVAAIVGYAAISFLIKGLARWGMRPFAWYCLAAGVLTVAFL